MNKSIKYRLYPTQEQEIMFAKTFGCCRKVYNLMLSDKITSYQLTGKFASVTPAKYKSEYPYLSEVDSLALANAQLTCKPLLRIILINLAKRKTGSRNSNLQNIVGNHTQLIIKMVQLPFLKKV